MNLQQLEYIIAVDRLQSFSKAAAYCHVTQATLSAMIKKLEEELSLVLFDRKAKPVITTDCGKEIIQEAKKVLYHSNELLDLAKSVQGRVSGEVKLAIIPTIASSLLPLIIKPILTKYPDLHLTVVEITTDEIVKSLKEGDVDIGILATPIEDKSVEENILYYETLLVYGDVQTDGEYLIPEEISNYKVWLFEEGHCLREQFVNFCALKEHGDQPENFRFEANSFDTLLNMVDNFGGITLIPELYIKNLTRERKQKIRQFRKPVPVREISLVYFRPFARFRIIQALTSDIIDLTKDELLSKNYQNRDMVIARI
ncbi:MAG: hydrogen peroxide-inducible genes activator [Saprospiraceae bacterium]|nr:LysR family transcriptional regulator [Lewinella sp.]